MPWERSIGKASASKLKIYAKNDGRYQISWYDQAGKRHVATRGTLAAARSFQTQKIAELQRHRETKFDSEDRQTYSEARELALDHGCTVLQAVREWYTAKGGSINSELLGKAIQKFLAAKRTRSPAYIDKLNADMRLVQSHFGADRPIDRIRSKEIEDFLDLKKATGRRRNNLRSEIITLFRYAQARLSALHRDRKTEAEFVMKDQEKSKSVETFSPQEFETFLGAVRPDWLAWLAIGGLAGVRTDGEIFRTNWEFFKWDQRQIDLPKEATKNNERRLVPICDRLFNILQPLRRDSGPVILLKKPEDETARLRRVTGIPWRRNALRHSFAATGLRSLGISH